MYLQVKLHSIPSKHLFYATLSSTLPIQCVLPHSCTMGSRSANLLLGRPLTPDSRLPETSRVTFSGPPYYQTQLYPFTESVTKGEKQNKYSFQHGLIFRNHY